jgi:hypothetical protein
MLERIEHCLENYSKATLRAKRWNQLPMHRDLQALHDRFSPSTYDYFFELNPSFHYQYHDLNNINEYPVIMLRDGFLGLFCFFANFPKPLENQETFVLVPKKFAAFVPKFWKDHVYFYSFENAPNLHEIKKVYVYGALTLDHFIGKTVEQSVASLKSLIPQNTKVIFLPNHQNHYQITFRDEMKVSTSYYKEVYKQLGFEIEEINEYKTELFQNAREDSGYINIDKDHFLIYDNYFDHFFAGRGAKNLRGNEASHLNRDNVIKTINLSLYHKIHIEKPGEDAFCYDVLKDFMKIQFQNIPTVYLHYEFYKYGKKLFQENFLK